jgi:flagellar biosynthesis/type III secretory pathway chaperone
MKLNFLILLFLTNLSFAQTESDFLTDFMLEAELHTENKLTEYQQFDFSGLWTNMPNNIVYGIIGNEHQRIRIKFLSILKSFQKPSVYDVQGKSMVKEKSASL